MANVESNWDEPNVRINVSVPLSNHELDIIYTTIVTHGQFNQTSSNTSSSDHYDIMKEDAVQALFSILYLTIFCLGIFGNFLVCFVVARNRAMQTVTNFFITNLAMSDILLCGLGIPFTPLYTFIGRWIFGRVLCHLVTYAQGVSVYISTFTLTSIAVDRYFVIIYPFHPRMKISVCVLIICIIWISSVLAPLPYGLYMNWYLSDNKYFCEELWPSKTVRQIFGISTVIIQFVLPFFVIAFCYVKVSLKLNDRARCKPGAKNTRREEADRERKRRTNRMLIAMVAIFGLSWLPLNLINIITDINDQMFLWKYYQLFFFMGHAVAMSSTCYNPFLYAWLNENFRKEFKQVLPCFDPAGGGAGLRAAGSASTRGSAWRQERTCNGNETLQETLLPSTVVARGGGAEDSPPGAAAAGAPGRAARKDDSVDVETVVVTTAGAGAAYTAGGEAVHLQLARGAEAVEVALCDKLLLEDAL